MCAIQNKVIHRTSSNQSSNLKYMQNIWDRIMVLGLIRINFHEHLLYFSLILQITHTTFSQSCYVQPLMTYSTDAYIYNNLLPDCKNEFEF